jgi:hypothetical protein
MARVTCLVVCSSHRTRPKTEATPYDSARLNDEQQDRWILAGAQVLSHARLAQKGFQTRNPLRPVGGPKPPQSHIGAKAEGRMMNAETPDKAA